MPRCKAKRKRRGGVFTSVLRSSSHKKREGRLKRMCKAGLLPEQNAERSNEEECVLLAAMGLLTLQRSNGVTLKPVEASPKSGSFTVTPLRSIADSIGSVGVFEKSLHASPSNSFTVTPMRHRSGSIGSTGVYASPSGSFTVTPLSLRADSKTNPKKFTEETPKTFRRVPLTSSFTESSRTGTRRDMFRRRSLVREIDGDPSPGKRPRVGPTSGVVSTLTQTENFQVDERTRTNQEEATDSRSASTSMKFYTQSDHSTNNVQVADTSGSESAPTQIEPQSDDPSNRPKDFVHWRYESKRNLSRKEFRRLTGVTQDSFEVIYDFIGGDEVCDHLKYDYEARTPKKKKPTYLAVNSNIRRRLAKKSPMLTWKDTTRMSSKDKLFMTLVRLRRGKGVEDLVHDFGISKTRASRIFCVWVQFLYLQFKRLQRAMCVTRHDQQPWKIASCYRRYKNFRMVIDTTEIRIQAPRHYRQQGNTWSTYKAGNVILYLIGNNGWGGISFISPGFEGSMSDRQIFEESGLAEYLEPGDLIVADRGFKLKDIMDKLSVTLVIPPSAQTGKPLGPEDLMLTKRIGSDRSHVERAIRKIKAFHILKKVTNNMLPILDQMVYVCGCLVNFDDNNVR